VFTQIPVEPQMFVTVNSDCFVLGSDEPFNP